jgi:hypothetical protein
MFDLRSSVVGRWSCLSCSNLHAHVSCWNGTNSVLIRHPLGNGEPGVNFDAVLDRQNTCAKWARGTGSHKLFVGEEGEVSDKIA